VQGEAQEIMGAARGGGGLRNPRQAHRPRLDRALRAASNGAGWQGDGGGHEPTHRRRALPRTGRAPPGVARRHRRRGCPQGRHDRLATDPLEWQDHIRNKAPREALAVRFRDAKDPFRIVIVRDMWLTGFDAPSLHTVYVDKPMRNHTTPSCRPSRAPTG